MTVIRAFWTLVLAAALHAAPEETGRPTNNSSFVPDDDPGARELVLAAEKAAREQNFGVAATKLQELVARKGDKVLAVRGNELYVSPRRWAMFALLGQQPPFGGETLTAWRTLHDKEASGALRAAMSSRDESYMLELIDRYPAATSVPAALMLLSDLALLRGERTRALTFLDRVPEHASLADEARILGGDAYRRRADHLRSLERPKPVGWPTTGGDFTRARRADALPGPENWRLLWETPLVAREPWAFRQLTLGRERLQSDALPFVPICDATRVYVHLGLQVAIYDRTSGKLVDRFPRGAGKPASHVDWMLLNTPGARAVTVNDGILYCNLLRPTGPRNFLYAYDVEKKRTLWVAGFTSQRGPGGRATRGDGVFFRGAPAIADGRLYVYGAVRDRGDGGYTRKEKGYLYCYDAKTGAPIWRRFLGFADTDAPSSFPPRSGLAPAIDRGVVVVTTGLGVAAALDARSGEFLWLLRHNRLRFREGQRLSREEERSLPHKSAWLREPPRIHEGSAYLAPFDSEELLACWLRGRRIDGRFFVVRWEKSRKKGHFNCLLESVGGFYGDRIFLVGRPDPRTLRLYESVVSVPLDKGRGLAYARLPATARDRSTGVGIPPEAFGTPLIAGRVLLLPTERALFRFDLSRIAPDAGSVREIAMLPPYEIPPAALAALAPPPGAMPLPPPPFYGSSIAADGVLYTATADRLLAYGKK